jgi:hypothetical protein
LETSVSTSSGLAPGSVVRTLTVGRSMAGKRSTPRRKYAAAPTTTSARMSMVAKTGRRMQISASFCMGIAGRRAGDPRITAWVRRGDPTIGAAG